AAHQARTHWIISVQDCEIFRLLVFEDAGFSVDVSVKARMAIQMVRSDVENDSDLRAERLNGFQLEAGDFQNDNRIFGSFVGERNCRGADIAAHESRKSAGSHNVSGE